MYLKCNRRIKDGKEHCSWSIMENRRCGGGKVFQKPVVYLGEISDSQRAAWVKAIEVFDEDAQCQRKLPLFAAEGAEWDKDHPPPARPYLGRFDGVQ